MTERLTGLNSIKQDWKSRRISEDNQWQDWAVGTRWITWRKSFTHNESDHRGAGPQRAAANSIADVKQLFNPFPGLLSRLNIWVASISAIDCIPFSAPFCSVLLALYAATHWQSTDFKYNLDSIRLSVVAFGFIVGCSYSRTTNPSLTSCVFLKLCMCESVNIVVAAAQLLQLIGIWFPTVGVWLPPVYHSTHSTSKRRGKVLLRRSGGCSLMQPASQSMSHLLGLPRCFGDAQHFATLRQ